MIILMDSMIYILENDYKILDYLLEPTMKKAPI